MILSVRSRCTLLPATCILHLAGLSSLRWLTFTPTSLHGLQEAWDKEELRAAREWLGSLNSTTIPRHIGELSFSRSSGPGGQNVNKVNSKATLKIPLHALIPLVPRMLLPGLRASRYLAHRTETLVIQSDDSRKRSSNVESCFEKFHQLLQATARTAIPGQTAEEQKDRVKKLCQAEKEARLRMKKHHSSKKSSRSSTRDID